MRDLLYRETLSGTVGTLLTAIFFIFFSMLVVYVYRSSRKSLYDKISRFPLQDGEATPVKHGVE